MNDDKDRGLARGMGAGIAIGAGVGVALGVSMDNIALGIAIGLAIGTAIGAALASPKGLHRGDVPGRRRFGLIVSLALGLLLLVVLAFLLMGRS